MKRIITSVIVLAPAVACAGTVAPIAAPAPQTPSPYAIELTGANVFATRSIMGGNTKKVNLAGPELTGVYQFNESHALTLRGSALFGRHSNMTVLGESCGKLDVSLMPGYRFSYHVSEPAAVFAGVNVGLMFTDINKRHSYLVNTGGGESAWGAAASAEIGFKYQVSESWSLLAGYEVIGDTARPTLRGKKQNCQLNHGFRAGFGYSF